MLLGALLLSGCTFSPMFDVTCSDEGARLNDKICEGGVWVTTDAGHGGGEDVNACVPETDQQLCLRAGFNCGVGQLTDNCGVIRGVACGSCAEGSECPSTALGVCDCADGSPEYTCATSECGDVPTTDNCGNPTTYPCGNTCEENESCGDSNACVCDEVAACAQVATGIVCGEVELPDGKTCGGQTTVQCGCGNNADCREGVCTCDAGFKLQGRGCVPEGACLVACDTTEECAEDPSNAGTYACVCIDGYERAASGLCEPIPPPPVLVTDVRVVTATFDTTSTDIDFMTPINAANSVPFVSAKMSNTGDDMRANSFSVELSDSGVELERSYNVGTIDAAVAVVQFDPAHVRVQSGSFQTNNTSTTVDLDEAIEPDHAFIVFYSRYSSNSDDPREQHDRALASAVFSNNGSSVLFSREGSSGRITGHFWVVDSSHFTVEHLKLMLGESENSQSIATTAEPDESFVLFSTTTSYTGGQATTANASCGLSAGKVECTRSASASTIELTLQVVSTDLIDVQHHTEILPADRRDRTVPISAVGERSIVSTGGLGIAGTQHVNIINKPQGYLMTILDAQRTNVELMRGINPAPTSMHSAWQVIDWAP